MVRIVEVDTDGPLAGGCPDPGPGPLGCPIGEGHAQIILNRQQRINISFSHLQRAGYKTEIFLFVFWGGIFGVLFRAVPELIKFI